MCESSRGSANSLLLSTKDESYLIHIYFQPDRCLKPSEWTDWSNKDKLIGAGKTKKNDIEPLPDSCGDRIFMVECRTVSGHKNFSETGENVDCSIHDGLVCAGKCSDYEIRASCECGELVIKQLNVHDNKLNYFLIEKDTNCTASPGFVRNECAYSCGSKACHYYKEIMISSETCGMNSHECIPGCVPEKNLTTCLSPKVCL